MKQLNITRILLALLFSMAGITASAHDIEVNNIFYNYTSDGTELIVTFQGDFYESYPYEYYGDVAIPEEVTYMNRVRKVTGIGRNAFAGCKGLSSVSIPNSVTSIGKNAFAGCEGLSSVTIPNSVTSIGEFAFSDCRNLTSVIIPNNVTSIKERTFSGCEKISSIIIPNNVTTIGDYAFTYCKSLSSLTIGNNVTNIENSAFSDCTDLTSVTIPNSVTSIGKNAFSDCRNLTSVIFGNNVTIIDDWAFSGCRRLSSITIPKTVTKIGSRAFYNTDFTFIISLIESPFSINSNAFSLNTFKNTTLYVPFGTIDKYRETEGWKDFLFIEEGTGGDTPTTKKCERPSISYYNGKLIFKCATEGATCLSTISDADITSYSSNEIQLGVTYHISVYATKPGFANSDEATATLCWIDVDPKAEGLDNVAEVRANAVLIQSYGNMLSVQGAEEGILISVYDTTGRCVGSARASNEMTSINTSLSSGDIGIVKIGEKAVKVVMK
ncbi:MAG: leucine-rich repeat domain-containing protein [Prevotella sp.]|nr:leucine-rich repeat domain-containing protein [Prevotella sp.]